MACLCCIQGSGNTAGLANGGVVFVAASLCSVAKCLLGRGNSFCCRLRVLDLPYLIMLLCAGWVIIV